MSNIKNEPGHLPKEKNNPPLGKWRPLTPADLNSFALKFEKQPLTSVSVNKVYSQMLNKEQKDEEALRFALGKLATDDDSSTTAWKIKIFLN